MNNIFQAIFAFVIAICINGILHERQKAREHSYIWIAPDFKIARDTLKSDSLTRLEIKKANESF